MRRLAVVLLALLACDGLGPAERVPPSRAAAPHPPCLTPLGSGVLLVARPSLGDTNFAHTVVLMLHYRPEGAVGLVINKPLDLDLAELIPEAKLPADHGIAVHYGGPVMPRALGFLSSVPNASVPDSKAPDDAIVAGVHTLRDPSRLAELVRSPGVKLRSYVGHASWYAGQLDAEFERGDWCVLPADSASVFSGVSGVDLWERLIEGLVPRPSA